VFLRNESSIKYFNNSSTSNNNKSEKYDEAVGANYPENTIDSIAQVVSSTPLKSSSSCRFQGNSVADLEFLDICKNQRDMFEV